MNHKIKTALGISPGTLQWSKSDLTILCIAGVLQIVGNIGGIGQGGGGSPVGWFSILLIMIMTYRKFSDGAKIIDPLSFLTHILHLISYVDDNSLL